MKGRVLVFVKELAAADSPAHFHGQRRGSRPIWRFFDVRVLYDCLPNRSLATKLILIIPFYHIDVLLNRVRIWHL